MTYEERLDILREEATQEIKKLASELGQKDARTLLDLHNPDMSNIVRGKKRSGGRDYSDRWLAKIADRAKAHTWRLGGT